MELPAAAEPNLQIKNLKESAARRVRGAYTRKSNWKEAAKLHLLQLVKEKRRIIEGKRFDTKVSSQARSEAFREITAAINAAYPDCLRNEAEVEKKWYGLKAQGREEISAYRKTLKGGGDSPKPLSNVAVLVQDILGPDNFSISGIEENLDAVLLQSHWGSESSAEKGNAVIEVNPLSITTVKYTDNVHEGLTFLENSSQPPSTTIPTTPVAATTSVAATATPAASISATTQSSCCCHKTKKELLELEVLRAKVSLLKAQTLAYESQSRAFESQSRAFEEWCRKMKD